MTAGRLRRLPGGDRLGALAGGGLALLAAGLRLPTLAQQSLWLDEGYTARLVHMNLGAMLHAIPLTESTPPLYYLIAWVWTRAFGYSAWALRSLSAVAGIATVTVIYSIASRLAGRRAGCIAGALVAVSPLMVWFSQEARAYALATLLAAGSFWCFLAATDGRGRGWLVGWAITAGLGLATHYFVVFLVAPEAAWLLSTFRRDKPTLAAVAVVGVVALVLVPLALAQRGTGHADYISHGALITRIVQVPKQFLVGYASPDQLVTGIAASALVLVGAVWALVRQPPSGTRVARPLTCGLAVMGLPIALAILGIDFLNTRNLLPGLPLMIVVLAVMLASLGARAGTVIAASLATLSVLIVVLVDANPRYQRDDWRGASRALGAATRPRVIVLLPGSELVALAAYQTGLRVLRRPVASTELDVVQLPGHVQGQGLGPLARPLRWLRVSPRFHLVRSVYSPTYTVIEYRANAGTAVGRATVSSSSRRSPGLVLLVQQPAR